MLLAFYDKINKYERYLVLIIIENLLCVNVLSSMLSMGIILLNLYYSFIGLVVLKIVKG